jgi:hypothetical protein
LRHKRGEYREHRRSCAESQQRKPDAKQHGDHTDHQADDGELAGMRGPFTQHAEAN